MSPATAIAIGCMRLSIDRDLRGANGDDARAIEVLYAAFDGGVTFLDTADTSTWEPVHRTAASRAASAFSTALQASSSRPEPHRICSRSCLPIDPAATETSHSTFRTRSLLSKASWTASISCGGFRRNRCRL